MRIFQQRELTEARHYAALGGQAIHLHKIIGPSAPKCFKDAVRRGNFIAHLFDQDAKRLVQTVKRLGVKIVIVERSGTPSQHVDLCGWPLRRAMEEAKAQKGPTS